MAAGDRAIAQRKGMVFEREWRLVRSALPKSTGTRRDGQGVAGGLASEVSEVLASAVVIGVPSGRARDPHRRQDDQGPLTLLEQRGLIDRRPNSRQ